MKTIHAVAAILVDSDGRILVAERPKGKIMAGYWEFPGGKIEPGETPENALKRELEEELGIELGCNAPLTFISEAREDHHVVVLFYLAREWEGIISPTEGQRVKWVRFSELKEMNLLPSNLAMLHILREIV